MLDRELALPDYDHVAVTQLPRLLQALDQGELACLLKYEAAHANRPVVKRILTIRMMMVAAAHQSARW